MTKVRKKPLTQAERAAARADARMMVIGHVLELYERLVEQDGLTQVQVAERLGVSRALVSRLVAGSGNWTLDTVGDLLGAMDARIINVEVRRLSELQRLNSRHDLLLQLEANKPRAATSSASPNKLVIEERAR